MGIHVLSQYNFIVMYVNFLAFTTRLKDMCLVHYEEKDACLYCALVWCVLPSLSAIINEIHLRSRARQINPIRFCHSSCGLFFSLLCIPSLCGTPGLSFRTAFISFLLFSPCMPLVLHNNCLPLQMENWCLVEKQMYPPCCHCGESKRKGLKISVFKSADACEVQSPKDC